MALSTNSANGRVWGGLRFYGNFVIVLVRKRLVTRIKNLFPAEQARCETDTSYKSRINRIFDIINT